MANVTAPGPGVSETLGPKYLTARHVYTFAAQLAGGSAVTAVAILLILLLVFSMTR